MSEITYSDAKGTLEQKFKATEQEIVRWILDKEITPKGMWVFINVGGKEIEVPHWQIDTYEYDESMYLLERLKFNDDEINSFAPKVRYETFNQVMERFPKSEENIKIRQKRVAEKLREQLPAPTIAEIDNGKSINLYVYPLDVIENIFPLPKQLRDIQNPLSDQQSEIIGNDGTGSQAVTDPAVAKGDKKKPRARKTNLSRAIHAAIKTFVRKPSLEELWQFFQDDKDETGFIHDYTETHITWQDTKGKFHDTQKETIANHLSRIKS